jgi:hypothetical protein
VIATIAEQRKRNCGITVSLHSSGRHFSRPKQTFLYLFTASHSRAGREASGCFGVGRRGPPRRFESDPAAALQILLVDPKKVFHRPKAVPTSPKGQSRFCGDVRCWRKAAVRRSAPRLTISGTVQSLCTYGAQRAQGGIEVDSKVGTLGLRLLELLQICRTRDQ